MSDDSESNDYLSIEEKFDYLSLELKDIVDDLRKSKNMKQLCVIELEKLLHLTKEAIHLCSTLNSHELLFKEIKKIELGLSSTIDMLNT